MTGVVVTVNVACVAPAAIEIVAGTEAAVLALARLTVVADEAAADSVTVPVTVVPPVTAVLLSVSDFNRGSTVRDAEKVNDSALAVIITGVKAGTSLVTMLNVATDSPNGTVTVAGGEAAASLVVRPMTNPPEGAVPVSVAVPVTV